VRISSGVPMSCSSAEMRCDTAEGVMFSWVAAASRLPLSTAARKASLRRGSIFMG
jgi:hypothetical protein